MTKQITPFQEDLGNPRCRECSFEQHAQATRVRIWFFDKKNSTNTSTRRKYLCLLLSMTNPFIMTYHGVL